MGNVQSVIPLWVDKMIMWNYRIIKEKIDGMWLYYITEVFYEKNKPVSWSEPATGYYDSRLELIKDLKLMLKDSSCPTLEVSGDNIKSTDS